MALSLRFSVNPIVKNLEKLFFRIFRKKIQASPETQKMAGDQPSHLYCDCNFIGFGGSGGLALDDYSSINRQYHWDCAGFQQVFCQSASLAG